MIDWVLLEKNISLNIKLRMFLAHTHASVSLAIRICITQRMLHDLPFYICTVTSVY